MRDFLKTTILGGALFLVPVVLVAVILDHALRFAAKIAKPISGGLKLDQLGEWEAIGAATVIAVLILILISFIAGFIARTNVGKRLTRSFESSLLGSMPQYQLAKSMAEGLAQIEGESQVKPVLVSVEDGWQIGYLLEPVGNGWVAVFLPQAPTPMSGNVMYFPSDRVRPLEITMVQAMSVVKHIGVGSGDLLRGVDLSLPKAASQ
jgi:uncharacterized membrane protein